MVWGGSDSAPRSEKVAILDQFEGQDRVRAGWHMRTNTDMEAEPKGHPNRVVRGSLIAVPLYDLDGLLYAAIYGERGTKRIALRVAEARWTRKGKLGIADADWELAARRWESGKY